MSTESKLGSTPTGSEGRDAVHIAIIPAKAEELLLPGTPVKLTDEDLAIGCRPDNALGVVDPFLGGIFC